MAKLSGYELLSSMPAKSGPVDAVSAEEVLQAMALGIAWKDIFFSGKDKTALKAVEGQCRLVANSLQELRQINAAVGLTVVGLRLIPSGYEGQIGIPASELPEVARVIKTLPNISVGGCFICAELTGLHGKELGRYFRVCYETAKQMTVVLPCAMPYLCLEGALDGVKCNAAQHPETLDDCLKAAQIVAMQNKTAFYARLLIR